MSCNKGYRFSNACTVFVKRSLHCGEGFYEVNIKFGAQRVFNVSGSCRIFLTQIPISAGRKFCKVRQQEIKGQGGFSRQFTIGVCRQGSQNLTLFKGRKSRFDTLFKAQNQKNIARFKGVTSTSARTAIRPFKIAVLNLKMCIQACSTVLIDPIFFVLRVGVDTAIWCPYLRNI